MLLFFIRIQMVAWSSHLGNILWRPRRRVQTARVWPLRPPFARNIAMFASFASCRVPQSDPVWRDGDKCLSAQSCLNCLSWLCLPNENQLSRWAGPIHHIGVKHCSPANDVVALVDFTQGVSCTLKHLRWILKQIWFLHWTCSRTCYSNPCAERILA